MRATDFVGLTHLSTDPLVPLVSMAEATEAGWVDIARKQPRDEPIELVIQLE